MINDMTMIRTTGWFTQKYGCSGLLLSAGQLAAGLLLVLLCWQPFAYAAEDVIEDIELRNLERVNANVIFDKLTITIGDTFDQQRLSQELKRLFTLDYFDDIRLEREGNTLVVIVEERPTIRRVILDDDLIVPEDQLRASLSAQLIAEGDILRRDTLSKIEAGIELTYSQNGQYGTKITAETEDVGGNLVDINIRVQEAPVSSIAKINIIGNQVFTDQRILDDFETEARSTWNSFWSGGKGTFSSYVRQRLEGDLGRLRDLYFEHGYIDFVVQSTQVTISRDRANIYISIAVYEGQKYTIQDIEFLGDLIIDEEQYRALLQIAAGDIYVDGKVTASKLAMERLIGDIGYGFAKINLNLDKNLVDHTVALRFFINPGNRTYVRRVTFKGNTKTADEVLRRELRQMEGSWYSHSTVLESKARLNRLGFFATVDYVTVPVPDRLDQLDIEFTVVERGTGSFSGGLTYSDLTGVGINLAIKEKNIFGTGDSIGINIDSAKRRQTFDFSWGHPYLTKDGVNFDTRLFYSNYNYEDTDIANYAVSSYGGSFGFSYPVSNNIYLGYGFSYTRRDIVLGSTPVLEASYFTNQYGIGIDTLSYNLNATYNNLNRGVFPTRGMYHKGNMRLYPETSSNPGFYSLSYNGKAYFPFDALHQWVSRTSTRLSYGNTFDGTDNYPFLFNVYAGGYGTVRGYNSGSIGPRSTTSDGEKGGAIGGNILTQLTQEIIFPLWFSSNSVRTSVFFDTGNVFTSNCVADVEWCSEGFDSSELRSSYGITLVWYTVVGPLVFIVPRAINAKDTDTTSKFEFRIGQIF